MIYIESLNTFTPLDEETLKYKKLFLAGGITNCPNWQKRLVRILDHIPIVIFNPRRENFPIHDPNASKEQITWEFERFRESDMISFWFSRGSLNPIVLFELGKWLVQTKKEIFIGIDPKYKRRQDVEIQTKLERSDIDIVYSLEDLAWQILKKVKESKKK